MMKWVGGAASLLIVERDLELYQLVIAAMLGDTEAQIERDMLREMGVS